MSRRRPDKPRAWRRLKLLRELDARGATYSAVPGCPGWYCAEFYDPGLVMPDSRPIRICFNEKQRQPTDSKALIRAVIRRAGGTVAP